LKIICPIIELNLTSWENTYFAKVAKTLTKEDCLALYSPPNTAKILAYKFFCILAPHIAGRNCETTYLTWNSLMALHSDDTNEKSYRLSFDRKKRRGNSSSHAQYCIITGEIELIFSVLLFLILSFN